MILLNNTAQDVGWDSTWTDGGDCGSLGIGQSQDGLDWIDRTVTVNFVAPPYNPQQVTPFSIQVDQTGTGTTVTIGLYYE